MRHLALWLCSLTFVLCASTTSARAQTSAQNGFQTVTSPLGYQVQIPSSWSPVSAPHRSQVDNIVTDFDPFFSSPDGAYLAVAVVYTGIPDAQAILSSLSPSAVFRRDGAAIGVLPFSLPGGLTGYASRLDGPDVPTLLSGPDVINVPNADSAVTVTFSVPGKDGAKAIGGTVVAAQGQAIYVLNIFANPADDQSSAEIDSILGSLQLAQPGVS